MELVKVSHFMYLFLQAVQTHLHRAHSYKRLHISFPMFEVIRKLGVQQAPKICALWMYCLAESFK